MNYRKLYLAIIKSAKSQNRSKKNGYYEDHHILPKSLFPNWDKRKSNKVLLTAKEHYFVHELLYKIYPSYEMAAAWMRLSNDGRRKVTMREYEKCKVEYSKWCSKTRKGENNTSFGKHWFTNGSVTIKCKVCPDGFWRGRTYTKESLERLRTSAKTRKRNWYTNGKENIWAETCPDGWGLGRVFEEKPRGCKGLHWFTNGVDNVSGLECPSGFWEGRYLGGRTKRTKTKKGRVFAYYRCIETGEIDFLKNWYRRGFKDVANVSKNQQRTCKSFHFEKV